MNRREFMMMLGLGGAALALPTFSHGAEFITSNIIKKRKDKFAVEHTEEEWKKMLSPEAFNVLRNHATERSGSSPLNNEKRNGVFHCAGCDHKLFSSKAKYESGSGWPSFYEPINKDAVGKSTDFKLILPRTEIHCANCGGHLGHVFDDGPQPTGLRYCMNGAAMRFQADK